MSLITEFRVKRIQWLDGPRSILLQEANGPCPILGLANVIALVPFSAGGGLKLPADAKTCSVEHMLSVVAEYALAKVSTVQSRSAAAMMPDIEARVNEFIQLLPSLIHGVNLNPRLSSKNFSRVLTDTTARSDAVASSFEFDNATSIYDVINVQLVHAWMVSPHDGVSAVKALENVLYSKAQEMLVSLDAAATATATATATDMKVVKNDDEQKVEESKEGLSESKEGLSDDPAAATSIPSPLPSPSPPPSIAVVPTLSPEAFDNALAVKDWLLRYPTQATPWGVAVLNSLLRDSELACLCTFYSIHAFLSTTA
jgi:hypothetical protein